MDNLPPAELLIALREQAMNLLANQCSGALAHMLRSGDWQRHIENVSISKALAAIEAALQANGPQAAATIERLEARVGEAEDERDEAVNWSAIVDRHGTDGFDALGDRWLAMEGVQRMHKAVSSVFAKYASDEIMTRFREHMTTIMHQSFVEGCLVGVRAEMAKAANFLAAKGAGDE